MRRCCCSWRRSSALALGFAAWLGRRRRIRLARRWSPALGRLARARGAWAPLVLGLVGLAVVVALAGPRWGRTEIRTESRALSLVFAVDISRSMLAEDAQPNRLQRAIRESRRLIQDLEGDRLGLIAFAGRSYILAPLTVDGGAIRMYLDALDPDLASEGGTDALERARAGRRSSSAPPPTRRTGCWWCSPTARRTTRCPRSCARRRRSRRRVSA